MRGSIVGFIGVTLIAASATAANCKIEKYAEMPVTMSGTRPIVAGTINGMPAKFVLDSGAFYNTMPHAVAKKYGFTLKAGKIDYMVGAGGNSNVYEGNAKTFSLNGFLGGQQLQNIKFFVADRFTAGDNDGLIGQNTIGHDDTEYDLANGYVRLFRTKDCGDAPLAYWHGTLPVHVVDFEGRTPHSPHVLGTATLNGKEIRVMFDTGASRSILTTKTATRLGIKLDDDKVVAAGTTHGIGEKVLETSRARFDEFNIGGEIIKNARLNVSDIELMPGGSPADMLLGADFFLSHRIYIAALQHKLYFTYNGGRVFDLGAPSAQPAAQSATLFAILAPATNANAGTQVSDDAAGPPKSAAAVPSPDTPADAKAYVLRGAASAARRDFIGAIKDFDEAIKLEQLNSEAFYRRGMAKLQLKQTMPALKDFDWAVKIKPDYVDALIERGTLRIALNSQAGARYDFETIQKLAPNDPTLGLRMAAAYVNARYYNEGIEYLDRWIAAHPSDERFPVALSQRCRSRAVLGTDLDTALADCNDAVKRQRTSNVLDSRGLLYLKRNESDKAVNDFKASLKLQPRNALTLYGLGLAQTKKGSKIEGDKNIAAAKAIEPKIGEYFDKGGFTG